MSIRGLFEAVADAFDGPREIEQAAQSALRIGAKSAAYNGTGSPLPADFIRVMSGADAHPVCQSILATPLDWAPPTTSDDPAYVAHSHPKVHVELLGPGGIVRSDKIRIGLYGILPNAEYGIRTHPAEEIFVMLAGNADWKHGNDPYTTLGPGQRSFHPSMMPHATRTTNSAFMSAYVWNGDISTENYVYQGIPS